MKYQGSPIQQKNIRSLVGKNLCNTLRVPVALTTLFLLSSGYLLLPVGVNADTTQINNQNTTQTGNQNTTQIEIQNTTQTGNQNTTQGTPVPVTGNVVYVNPATGSDSTGAGTSTAQPYKTITYALSQAQPGTTIQLAPGTYNKESGEVFPLTIKQGVTLRGDQTNQSQPVLIIGSGKYVSPTFASQNVTIKTEKDSTISGVTVTNQDSRGTAVWVESTNPRITNSIFTNSARDGIFVTGKGTPTIENNIFVQNKGNGISVAKSAAGVIRNNVFEDTGFGLAIGGTSTPLVEGNQIIGNQDGIYINDTAKPILRKNIIQGNKRDGVVATINAAPDLGTSESPGGNLIRSNTRYDLNNATKTIKILAVGNDIDTKKIAGSVEFVASTVDVPAGGFRDVTAGYWAKTYIEALASKNIIAGFPDGTFKPNDPVTRAQFAAIVTKAFAQTQPKREATNFSDVNSKFWAYDAIRTAYRLGFVSGYPDRTFKPQQKIPRVQALVSLSSGLNLTASNQNVLSFYSDAAQIPSYATGPVAAATTKLLVVNYPNAKQLNPNREATRAEVAAFVYQALVSSGQFQAVPSPYLVRVQ
jgi:parallel beta-helix repeat protein